MTLRARLTAAFLAMVLGPVLIGAFFVASTVTTVSQTRSAEHLSSAERSARTYLDALCVRLKSTAQAAAMRSRAGQDPSVPAQLVAEGRVGGVRLTAADGHVLQTAGQLPEPARACDAAYSAGPVAALVGQAAMRDQSGQPLGAAVVSQPVDERFRATLAAELGVEVTLGPVQGDLAKYSRKIQVGPLALTLSDQSRDPHGLYATLLAVVVVTGLAAVVAAWVLARSTTRPLAELADAADRVAGGDFEARVPVRTTDEVGQLATTFNRMTREMQGYVQALTASREQVREATRLSRTDPLTGLANYRHLQEALGWEIERARFDQPLAVLALDLDRFKEVNDTYGHPIGDAVLIEVARRLEHEIRDVDRAFRQGGEEFVLLLPETDLEGGTAVAERLGAALRDRPMTFEAGAVRVRVTVSIGIAVHPRHGGTGEVVLAAADDALYAAKAAGRDTYRVAGDGVAGVSDGAQGFTEILGG